MGVSVRAAVREDTPLVLKLINDLAAYEKLANEVEAKEADIARDLFGSAPRVFCAIAEWDAAPVGFALWYYTYSTFQGRHGIWLEDLFVEPAARGRGIGKALLAHLARQCIREGLGRLEWAVLDWNQPSIDFYLSQGAVILTDWERCRLSGDALERLGASA